MKNVKLASLLVLMSGLVLSGCGGEKPAPKSIDISINLPDKVYVSEEVDLSKYITVTGTDAEYKIVIDPAYYDVIDMDGTKLYSYNEGEIKFKVEVDGESKEATLNVTSHVREIFTKETKDIGYKYSIWELGDDGELNGNYVTHGENYYFTSAFDYDDVKQEYISGGYYSDKTSRVYSYTVSSEIDPEGYIIYGEPVFKITGNEPDFVSEVNLPFNISADDCIYSPKKEGKALQNSECLIYKGDPKDSTGASLYNTISGLFGISKYVFDYYGYEPKYLTFEVLYDEQGEYFSLVSQLFVTYQGATGLLEAAIISTDPNDAGCPSMDEFIESGDTPKGMDISDQIDAIESVIKGNNFTSTVSASWFESTDDGLVKLEENPVASTKEGVGVYIIDWFNANESVVNLVTENQVASYRPNDIAKAQGYIVKDNVAYSYSYENRQDPDVPGIYAYSLDKDTFRDDRTNPFGNYTFLEDKPIFNDGSSVYDGLFVNSISDDGSSLSFNGSGSIELMISLFDYSIPEVPMSKEEAKKYNAFDVSVFTTIERVLKFIENENCMYFFTGNLDIKKNGEDVIESIEISFSFAMKHTDEKVYCYSLKTVIDNIGSTSIPGDFPTINYVED